MARIINHYQGFELIQVASKNIIGKYKKIESIKNMVKWKYSKFKFIKCNFKSFLKRTRIF